MRSSHIGKNRFHHFAGAAAAGALAIMALPGAASAATIRMPASCSSVSACMSSMTSGDTLLIADGVYSGSVSGIKAGTIVQAENDGKVQFTGSFNPGSAGFEMRGIVVKSSGQKELGSGNTYRRMSFVGGPSCGNNVNSLIQRVAGTSLGEIENLITELESLRDLLHAEGQRVQREIAGYAHLSHAAMKSTRIIAENLAQWKSAAENFRQS